MTIDPEFPWLHYPLRPARWRIRRQRGFWWLISLPPYHRGRGWYVSIGLGFFAIYRGY